MRKEKSISIRSSDNKGTLMRKEGSTSDRCKGVGIRLTDSRLVGVRMGMPLGQIAASNNLPRV